MGLSAYISKPAHGVHNPKSNSDAWS